MRQRQVNEKAVSKLIAFLKSVKEKIDSDFDPDIAIMQSEFNVSKSTYSVMKKLKIVAFDELAIKGMDSTVNWIDKRPPCREMALQILEFLRQRSDKQTDKPISDLWCQQINDIKLLLAEVRDNTKKQNNRSEGFKIGERVYIAGQIASGFYSDNKERLNYENLNNWIVQATNDLVSKLNS